MEVTHVTLRLLAPVAHGAHIGNTLANDARELLREHGSLAESIVLTVDDVGPHSPLPDGRPEGGHGVRIGDTLRALMPLHDALAPEEESPAVFADADAIRALDAALTAQRAATEQVQANLDAAIAAGESSEDDQDRAIEALHDAWRTVAATTETMALQLGRIETGWAELRGARDAFRLGLESFGARIATIERVGAHTGPVHALQDAYEKLRADFEDHKTMNENAEKSFLEGLGAIGKMATDLTGITDQKLAEHIRRYGTEWSRIMAVDAMNRRHMLARAGELAALDTRHRELDQAVAGLMGEHEALFERVEGTVERVESILSGYQSLVDLMGDLENKVNLIGDPGRDIQFVEVQMMDDMDLAKKRIRKLEKLTKRLERAQRNIAGHSHPMPPHQKEPFPAAHIPE